MGVTRSRRLTDHSTIVPRYSGIGLEAHLNAPSQRLTSEDAGLPARRSYSSERRAAISVVRLSRIREISRLGICTLS